MFLSNVFVVYKEDTVRLRQHFNPFSLLPVTVLVLVKQIDGERKKFCMDSILINSEEQFMNCFWILLKHDGDDSAKLSDSDMIVLL